MARIRTNTIFCSLSGIWSFAKQGFAQDVAEVQRLWAEGDRLAAAARVPIEIGLRQAW